MPLKEQVKQLAESNLQVILTDAPGTGKTFTARQVAEELVCEGVEGDEK
jgi:transcriptional regulator with AAA-type ATPase domain